MDKQTNNKNIYLLIIIALLLVIAFLLGKGCGKTNPEPIANTPVQEYKPGKKLSENTSSPSANISGSIEELTAEAKVVPYVKANGRLPDYYITKREARQQGWNASAGNLCEVLPGRAIGGDVFTNREGNLPEKNGRTWYEADLDYNCGNRNAHRLLYSSDGLVFVTYNHYKTFEER